MSEEALGSLRMEATLFQAIKDGDPSLQVAIEDRGEGRLGLTVSLPLPSGTDWISVRLDLTSAAGLTAWLGHAMRVIESTATPEEHAEAKAMLDSLSAKSQHPENRQQRRAAQRREGKR